MCSGWFQRFESALLRPVSLAAAISSAMTAPRQVRVRSTGFSSTVWLRAIEEGPTCSFVLEPSTARSVV